MSVVLDILMVIFIKRNILPLQNVQTLANLENVSSVSATLEQGKATILLSDLSIMVSVMEGDP